jgi:hypothetical protein
MAHVANDGLAGAGCAVAHSERLGFADIPSEPLMAWDRGLEKRVQTLQLFLGRHPTGENPLRRL